jgi:mannose-6-phosphate isomerase class I
MPYDPYPKYPTLTSKLGAGFSHLEKQMADSPRQIWLLDGSSAIDWKGIRRILLNHFSGYEIIGISSCRKKNIDFSSLCIESSFFNRYFQGDIRDLFDENELKRTAARMSDSRETKKPVICLGTGSSLLDIHEAGIAWLHQSFEQRESNLKTGSHSLFGCPFFSAEDSYEYIDYPVLNPYLADLVKRIRIYVDFSNLDLPVFMDGTVLKANLEYYAARPFRVQPIFYAKTWGGQWLKKNLDVANDMANTAGSLEFSQRENELVLFHDELEMRVPLEIILFANPESVLGSQVHARFGSEFPFRLNLTDTIEGEDLSCQVHPDEGFTAEYFRKAIELDEKYFVIHSEKDARVNLGLKDGANLKEFIEEVKQSESGDMPVDISQYVDSWPVAHGDVFYIPPGTIHNICSGNLIMEIISANSVITFRFYDYLRKDQQGNPRPLHIQEAARVLKPDHTTSRVKQSFMPQFSSLSEGDKKEYSIPQYESSFTKMNRIFLDDLYQGNTGLERFQLLTLVKGESMRVEWGGGYHVIQYLETIFIPGHTGKFRLVNQSVGGCTILKVSIN